MLQAIAGADPLKGLVAQSDRAAVTPDDRRPQDMFFFVHQYQSVHLVTDANGFDLIGGNLGLFEQHLGCEADIFPPDGRLLFGPSRLPGDHIHLMVRKSDHACYLVVSGFYQCRFDGRTSYVKS